MRNDFATYIELNEKLKTCNQEPFLSYMVKVFISETD